MSVSVSFSESSLCGCLDDKGNNEQCIGLMDRVKASLIPRITSLAASWSAQERLSSVTMLFAFLCLGDGILTTQDYNAILDVLLNTMADSERSIAGHISSFKDSLMSVSQMCWMLQRSL